MANPDRVPLTELSHEISEITAQPPAAYRWWWNQLVGGKIIPWFTQVNGRWETERRHLPAIARAVYGDDVTLMKPVADPRAVAAVPTAPVAPVSDIVPPPPTPSTPAPRRKPAAHSASKPAPLRGRKSSAPTAAAA